MHTTGGYLLGATLSFKYFYIFGYQEDDIYYTFQAHYESAL